MCWIMGPEGALAPSTLDSCAPVLLHSREPKGVVSATFPFPVLNSNAVWRNLTGQIQVRCSFWYFPLYLMVKKLSMDLAARMF